MSKSRKRILSSAGANSAIGLVRRRSRGDLSQVDAKVDKLFRFRAASVDNYATELLRSAKSQLRPFRHGEYTHVSDVIHKCARKLALNRRLGMRNPSERIPDGQALTFAQGEAIHDYVKKRFIDGYPDRVWAQWRCLCGETTTDPMTHSRIPKDLLCKVCRKPPTQHVEHALFDDEYKVVGAPDVVLYLDEYPAYYVNEIKSMVAHQWDSLERPIPDHVIQAMFYWALMRKQGYSMMEQLSIIYVKKEWSFKWPYKEFVIEPLKNATLLEPFLSDLTLLSAAHDPAEPLPPRTFCATPEAPEAKKCNVCTSCFALP